jgi:hypothetical protein
LRERRRLNMATQLDSTIKYIIDQNLKNIAEQEKK